MNQGETVKSDNLSTLQDAVKEKTSSLPMNQDDEEMVDSVQGAVEEKTSSLPMNQDEEEMVDSVQGVVKEKTLVDQGETTNSLQDTTDEKTGETVDPPQDAAKEETLSVPSSENGNVKSSRTQPLTPEPIPVPPPVPRSGVPILAHKLWIGNLDKRLTEQNILQFVTKYGEVVSFRFHFKAGTERAEPRGYCFAEFSTREEAEKAKASLDGKIALGRKIIVDWARHDQGAKKSANAVSETWDASTVSESLDSGVSTAAKIAALEAKLKQMEEEELGISTKRPKLSTQEQLARARKKAGSKIQIIHRPSKRNHGRTV